VEERLDDKRPVPALLELCAGPDSVAVAVGDGI
jgi:hypothetical protein